MFPPDWQQLQMLECHSQSGDVKARGSIIVSAVWAPKNSRCTDTLKLFPHFPMFGPFQHFLPQKLEGVFVYGRAHVQGQSRQDAGVRQTQLSKSGPWIDISFQLHQISCWFRSPSPGKGEKPKWNRKYDRPWILREHPKLTAKFTSSLILIWKQPCNCNAQRHHSAPDSSGALGFTIGREGLQHILCTLGQDSLRCFVAAGSQEAQWGAWWLPQFREMCSYTTQHSLPF